ncbi:MAG: serine--tRNA ligase [Candidatus Marsarchaeota archaeon]|nr:serine--tRNA ligase [Candidatus Marsarchaeota archaeon]
MITTKYVRDRLDAIRASLEKRKSNYPLDELLKLDEEWRGLKTKLQELQTRRNKASLAISEAKKKGEKIEDKIAELGKLKDELTSIEASLPSYEDRINALLWNMPNVIDDSVKYGKDETENVEIRKWGTPKPAVAGHNELLEKKGLVDIERASKVAGARFYYLKGDFVLLAKSLERFALDTMANKGYTLVQPPYLMKREFYRGVTGLGDFEEMLYMAGKPSGVKKGISEDEESEELFLIATAEHPLAAMHANEVFSAKELPLRYVGVSPCFRREAGTHGKDTKGIFRVHQFDKVEQFIFCREEDSWKIYEEVIANEEEIFQKLGVPYHVMEMCTGDIGIVAAKKTDLEGWFPSQQKYREITSASNCTDWQSVRLDIKYDDRGERKYVHMLNGTAVSIERALTAIVENYANHDGTISVPDALVPYMGKSRIGQ